MYHACCFFNERNKFEIAVVINLLNSSTESPSFFISSYLLFAEKSPNFFFQLRVVEENLCPLKLTL